MRRLIVISLFVSFTAFAADSDKPKIKRVRDKVPDEYIVILQDDIPSEDVPALADQLTHAHDATLGVVWKDSIKGFVPVMTDVRAQAMSRRQEVKYVEENSYAYVSDTQPTNIDPRNCDPTVAGQCTSTVLDNRLWHLDRADQNYADPSNEYSYCTDGTGVTVYVVDMGVNRFHNEFANSPRIKPGYNATGTAVTNDHMPADDPCLGFAQEPSGFYENLERNDYYRNEIGLAGHGTAVASALGGRRVGIAKNVNIVPVKVSRCDKFSARARRSSQYYPVNKTVFRPTGSGSVSAIYRAMNSGTTAATDPYGSSNWPSADDAEICDGGDPNSNCAGGVLWKAIPKAQYASAQTTAMIIDGLIWILSDANTQGPKSFAIVTMSTWRLPNNPDDPQIDGFESDTMETAVRNLLNSNITVIASANNQNGNACDSSPARLSIDNPDTILRNNVITVGGSMLLNRPWSVDISDTTGTEANGGGKGVEPSFNWKEGVRDARWICGPGDNSKCANIQAACAGFEDLSKCTIGPTLFNTYPGFQAGSNAGPCVTLFAPAKGLFLASPAAQNAYRDPRVQAELSYPEAWFPPASGTSFSAPIVAGFAARIMQASGNKTPTQMRTILLENAGRDLDENTLNTYDHTGALITGTPNELLHLSDVNIIDGPHSTPAAISGPTTLSVSASGTSTLSYRWYEVSLTDGAAPGFDAITYKSGAHSPQASTLVSGASSNSISVAQSPYPRAFWVRVTNSCGSADSKIAVVVPRPSPASGLNALAGTGSVSLTWNAGSGATAYQVQRRSAGSGWTTAAALGNVLSYTDSTPPAGMPVYRVNSQSGQGYLEPANLATADPSNADFANMNASGYEPLAANISLIRAQHIIDMRLGNL